MSTRNGDLSINLNANLDTSGIQKTYDQIRNSIERQQLKIPIDVKVDNIMPQLNKNFTQFGQRLDANMQRINTKFSSTVGEINGQIENLIKTTETYKNKIGDVQERTSIWTENGKLLASSLNTIQNGVKDITTETEHYVTVLNGTESVVTKVTEKITDTSGKTETIVKTTTEWIDANNKLNQQLEITNEKGEQLSATQTKICDDTKKIIKVQNELAQTLGKVTPPKNEKTSTLTYVSKDGIKTVIQMNNGIKTLTTTIREYTNAQGALIKETKELNHITGDTKIHTEVIKNKQQEAEESRKLQERLKQERDERKKLQEQIDKGLISTTTSTSKGKIEQFGANDGRQYDALITTIRKVDSEGRKTIQTIYEFTNVQGQLVRQMRTTDQYGRKVAQDEIEISKAADSASKSTNNLNNATQQAAKSQKTLGEALGDALARLTRYYIASLPIRALSTAIREAITTVKEFDSALIEFRKVSDLAGESLTKYVAKLAEMGEVTGSTMQAMVEAATEFRKSGFSDNDSAQLASIAEKYRNIADEEISAGESASFIIAQMKAFNIEAGQAEHIIDSVNEVANNFSVSSADLAKNLGNMSEIMAINNVSMEQQIGMLTGVTEITRNASSASRGLVMISSRLTQVLDDSSSTGKKLTKIYDDLGIELKNENGQLRSHYDILGDLAKVWNDLSENQQKYIALTSAGARQQQNFVALMANWGQVAKATKTAYDSMGSAQRENEKVMDSITKKVEILKSQFQQLVIGKGSLQDFAKTILDIGIALLKFANSDIGKTIIKLTLLITTLNLLGKGFGKLNTYIIDTAKTLLIGALAVQGYNAAEIAATIATVGFSDAIKILGASFLDLLVNPAFLAVAALVALAGATIYAHQKAEEYNGQIIEARKEVTELKNEIAELEAVEKKEAELTQAEKDRLAYLEKRLELTEKIAKRQLAGEAPKSDYDYKETNLVTETGVVEYTKTPKRNLSSAPSNDDIRTYKELNQEIQNWNNNTKEGMKLFAERFEQSQAILNSLSAERDRLGELRDTYAQNAREYEQLTSKREHGAKLSEEEKEKLNNLENATKSLSIEESSRLASLEANIGAYKKSIDKIKTYQEALDVYGEESEEADSILQEFAKDLGISETQLQANANALGLSIDAYYQHASAVKANDEALDNFQSSLGTLQQAVEEYNESQYLSIDTIQSLLQLQPEYLSMLVDENGQLKLNEQAIVDKCNALIEEKKQTALVTAYNRLCAIERGENQKAAENESNAISNNTIELHGETVELNQNTLAQVANQMARNDKSKGTAASQVLRELEQELAILDKIGDNYTKIAGSAKKAGSAGKSAGKAAKDAAKEAKKELEDLIKKYEQVIKYINKRYDREIKKIKDAKSEAIKAEEKKIKAVEKEKDHALDAIEKQIKALKKEQDARKKYWSDRIDALKKQNDALKDSLELQEKLDALEKARNTKVKVYKEGQGFVYDVDQTAVAEAQKALDEYLSEKAYEDELERLEALRDAELDNYEKRLDALNEYKDSVQENYEKQIEQMNEYKDQLSEQYDAQIDEWEKYKEAFGDLVDKYEEEQNKLLFEQLMGIKDENSNWLTRLDNLAVFVSKYNELQKKLNTGDTNVTNNATLKAGTGSGTGSPNRTGSTNTTTTKTKWDSSDRAMALSHQGLHGMPTNVLGKHASGVSSIGSDEIAIVGENPNQEIVIGSKINNGELMNLGKGTGVVNADSSKTLAGMLNQVGQFGASGFGSGNGTLNNNINNDSLTINGVTIQGANISDPQTFVNGLLSLKAEALQRAYKHR